MKISKITMLLISAIVSANVSAHVPFLKSNQFTVLHNRLQIEYSYTEYPFQADYAINAPTFFLINPEGNTSTITSSAKTKAAIYLTPELTVNGTYRISAGLRKGPNYRAIETPEGKLYFTEDTLTKKGTMTNLQYYSSADVYLSYGESNYKQHLLNKGVEIIPLSSPNLVTSNSSISFQVYQDGKPAANARVVVAYDNEHYNYNRTSDLYDVENERESNIYSDANGVFSFSPTKAGLVLLFVTMHKKIDDTLWESYNSSLTMEIKLPVE